MKKIIFSVLLAIISIGNSYAVVFQTVKLKNGSVLNGYIQQQKGKNISFRSDNAEICIDGKDVESTTDVRYNISQLDPKWVQWAEDNDAFEGIGDNRTLTLSQITFRSKPTNSYDRDSAMTNSSVSESLFQNEFAMSHPQIYKVRLLGKGVQLKYFELTPNIYKFSWDDVESVTSEKRPKTALSGIDRVYYLTNGKEVKGQYAGETYNNLSLYNPNGVIETFNLDDVNRYLYEGINPAQDIFQQSELLDIVYTKNNGQYRGIITERNFTDNNMYLVIQLSGGGSQILKFNDIASYSKEENPAYDPKSDMLLSKGEVMINRMPTDSVKVRKIKNRLYLDSINTRLVIPIENNGTRVIVEYNNPLHLSSDNLILVKIDKEIQKKKTNYFFSSDIYEMKKYIPVKSETSVNNTTRLEYMLPGRGVFAIYDQQTHEAIPFIIK